jgi:hypothetical protein
MALDQRVGELLLAAGELDSVPLEERAARAEAPQLLPLGDELGDPVPQLLDPVLDSHSAHDLRVAPKRVDRMWKALENSRNVRPNSPPTRCGETRPCGDPYFSGEGGVERPARAALIRLVAVIPAAVRRSRPPREASTSSGIGIESALVVPRLSIARR